MQHHSSSNPGVRLHAFACAAAVFFATMPAWAGLSTAPDVSVARLAEVHKAHGRAPARIYSVINIGLEASSAVLNERGQVLFGSFRALNDRTGFFDGDRFHTISSLGGDFTWPVALNNHGVVVGQSELAGQHASILPFVWTARRGTRVLPGPADGRVYDINDRGQIVGSAFQPGASERAIRWNPDRTITPLGPLPLSLSVAFDINECGLSTGFADVASGAIHATLWDQAGNLTDLGTLGGFRAFGRHINACNAVAGVGTHATEERELGFYWSRNSGMVPIDSAPGASTWVNDLNDRGEVVGDSILGESAAAYHWSLARGVVPLPFQTALFSNVRDINNKGAMVGMLGLAPAGSGNFRAMHWPGITLPVDLNTRLHRPPAGLVLLSAMTINDDGVILAHSNAGLVLLRPGTRGTDAPVLGPVMGLPDRVEVGQNLDLTMNFVDNDRTQTHTASASWADGCPSAAPTLTEARGIGQVRLQHTFCAPGWHLFTVRVADSGGRSTLYERELIVLAPALASISGKGTLGTLADGAGHRGRTNAAKPLQFALWAPLASAAGRPGAGSAGKPVVVVTGPFQVRSDTVSSISATGQQVKLAGTGRFNGRPGYRFALEASDAGTTPGAGKDHLRLRVTHVDPLTGSEATDFDNGAAFKARVRDHTLVVDGELTLRR